MLTLLVRKILSLSLIMAAGFFLIRGKTLSEEDSKSISRLCVYLVMPCSIFSAFLVSRTPEVLKGLGFTLLAALGIHIFWILLSQALRKPLKLSGIEQASILYTNAGNLVIPLVGAMLGPEWVIYTASYMAVQNTLSWCHGKVIICGEKQVNWKAILRNPNILAILTGTALLLLNWHLPSLLTQTLSSVGTMVGPISMLVTGMLLGTSPLGSILKNRRIWIITLFRLLVFPLLALGLLGLLILIFPGAAPYFLVTMIAASAPTAGVLTQISQLYDREPGYASSLCVMTTLGCILTIPLMITLYMRLFPV